MRTERSRGYACHDLAWVYVVRDARPGADHRGLADRDSAHDHRSRTEARAALDARLQQLPIRGGLEHSSAARGARKPVVDEEHSVPDEDLVADQDTLADESVALNLAVCADARARLDLDEGADASVVPDLAPVEVREELHDN